ncbi:hypothetical protein ACHAWC_010616 [Mediolabrus comicus]
MMCCRLLLLLLSAVGTSSAEKSLSSTCDCQPLGPPNESYLVTRLWNIAPSSNFTPIDVINEFDNGFAPLVTSMPGFQRYTASYTGNESTVFFMNSFDTAEHARYAQVAAKDFVENGTLNGVITPNIFTEDKVLVGFVDTNDEACITQSSKGQYLTTRVLQHAEDYIPPENQTDYFALMNDIISTVPGYVNYVLSTSSLEDEVPIVDFRYDIYEKKEDHDAASDKILPYIMNGTFNAVVSLDILVAMNGGEIVFDYLCTEEGRYLPPGGVAEEEKVEKEESDEKDVIGQQEAVSASSDGNMGWKLSSLYLLVIFASHMLSSTIWFWVF